MNSPHERPEAPPVPFLRHLLDASPQDSPQHLMKESAGSDPTLGPEQPLDAVVGAGGQWDIPGGRETQGMVLGLPEQGRDHRLRKSPQRDSSSASSGLNLLRSGSDVAKLHSTCTLIYSHRLRSPHIILIHLCIRSRDSSHMHSCWNNDESP